MNPFADAIRSFAHTIFVVFQAGFFVGVGLALFFHFVNARRQARISQNRWEERKGRDVRHYRHAA